MRQQQGAGSRARELDVHVHGLALGEQELAALRAEVGRIVAAEQVAATEEALLGARALASDAPGELSIHFEMSLPPGAQRRALERIEKAARPLLQKHLKGGHNATLLICNPKELIPGTVQNIDGLGTIPWPPEARATPPYPGTTNLQYAVAAFYFKNASGGIGEDIARLILEDGSRYWGQADPARIDVGLATQVVEGGSLGVDWEKAARSPRVCGNPYTYDEVRSAHRNPTPAFMVLRNAPAPDPPTTVIFRKAGWFGTWRDMYHLDPASFWRVLGGKRATFVWVKD